MSNTSGAVSEKSVILNTTNQLQKSYAAAKEVSKNSEIYLYFGHGTDLCDDESSKPIERIVPNNCIYITVSACGNPTIHKEEKNRFFLKKSDEVQKVLQSPYNPSHKKKIADALGFSPDDIHIHYPGQTYIESSFQPKSYWNNEIYFILSDSGLKEYSQIDSESSSQDYTFIKIAVPLPFLIKNATPTKQYLKANLKNIILSINFLSFQQNKINMLKYLMLYKLGKERIDDFDRVFEKLKEGKLPFIILDALIRSSPYLHYILPRLEADKLPGLIDSFFPTEKEEDILQDSKINDFLNKNIYVIPVKVVQEKFQGSVFPSQRFVRRLDTTKEMDYNEILNFFKNNTIIFDYSKMNNSNLMAEFPGIHYNLVCRSVDESCMPSAVLRRAVSSQGESNRQKLIETLGNQSGAGKRKSRRKRSSKRRSTRYLKRKQVSS